MDGVNVIDGTEQMFTLLKDMEEKQPERFEELGATRCGHCRATGLLNGNDVNRPCPNCIGIGYMGIKEFMGENTCPSCNGSGYELGYENHVNDCSTCQGAGRIDWVTAIRKGIDINKIW